MHEHLTRYLTKIKDTDYYASSPSIPTKLCETLIQDAFSIYVFVNSTNTIVGFVANINDLYIKGSYGSPQFAFDPAMIVIQYLQRKDTSKLACVRTDDYFDIPVMNYKSIQAFTKYLTDLDWVNIAFRTYEVKNYEIFNKFDLPIYIVIYDRKSQPSIHATELLYRLVKLDTFKNVNLVYEFPNVPNHENYKFIEIAGLEINETYQDHAIKLQNNPALKDFNYCNYFDKVGKVFKIVCDNDTFMLSDKDGEQLTSTYALTKIASTIKTDFVIWLKPNFDTEKENELEFIIL